MKLLIQIARLLFGLVFWRLGCVLCSLALPTRCRASLDVLGALLLVLELKVADELLDCGHLPAEEGLLQLDEVPDLRFLLLADLDQQRKVIVLLFDVQEVDRVHFLSREPADYGRAVGHLEIPGVVPQRAVRALLLVHVEQLGVVEVLFDEARDRVLKEGVRQQLLASGAVVTLAAPGRDEDLVPVLDVLAQGGLSRVMVLVMAAVVITCVRVRVRVALGLHVVP